MSCFTLLQKEYNELLRRSYLDLEDVLAREHALLMLSFKWDTGVCGYSGP